MIDIKSCLSLAEDKSVINKNEISILHTDDFIKSPDLSFRKFILNMKNNIDRWDEITQFIIFNHCLKDIALHSLKKNIEIGMYWKYWMWGSEIIFSTDIQPNTAIALAYEQPIVSNHVSIGMIDEKILEKLLNLKSFW